MGTRLVVGLAAVLAGAARPADAQEGLALKGHKGRVTAVAWSADGKALATAGDDRTARTWDPATGRQTAAATGIARDGYGGPVVAFTADFKVMAVNYWGEITIRTLPDGKEVARFASVVVPEKRVPFRPDVFAMAFSPDGKRLAAAASVGNPQGLPRGQVTVWDVSNRYALQRFDTLSTAGSSVAWSPDGKRLVAGTVGVGGELPEPGEVVVWDAATGKVLHSFKVKAGVEQGEWASAGDVAFSADGKRVAAPVTAGSRGAPAGLIIEDTGASVRVWDLTTGTATQPVKGLKAAVGQVVFSPDGKLLATAGADKAVRLWDAATGKEVAAFPLGDERAEAVAFSPDGKSLAAGGSGGTVRIWAVSGR